MGQTIVITGTTVVGDIALFDTDRSITGQDGRGFDSAEDTAVVSSYPGELAQRLFSGVDDVSHVFVASNQVVIGRSSGWHEDALALAREIVTNFFVFYDA